MYSDSGFIVGSFIATLLAAASHWAMYITKHIRIIDCEHFMTHCNHWLLTVDRQWWVWLWMHALHTYRGRDLSRQIKGSLDVDLSDSFSAKLTIVIGGRVAEWLSGTDRT